MQPEESAKNDRVGDQQLWPNQRRKGGNANNDQDNVTAERPKIREKNSNGCGQYQPNEWLAGRAKNLEQGTKAMRKHP